MKPRPSRDARRAAGRLCFVDFPGPQAAAALQRMIAEDHVAGVVLFRKNIVSPSQVAELTGSLQAIARDAGAPPLWMSIDHEGGMVTRFPPTSASAGPAMTALPSAMALGAAGDAALAHRAGEVAGRELRALGIHLNFAPVLDVNNNPANPAIGARAFGETPALVEAMGLGYVQGLQASGVAATAKHFPGHGDVTLDSHLGLPRVAHDLSRLEAVELAPFAAAARAGVAAVMTAHIVYPRLDPSGVPATMSAPILTGLLRDRLGFGGIVISDSLSMRAIVDHFGVGEAAVAAIGAGCDVVLALGPEGLQREVLEHLAGAIESGAIPAARVAAATARTTAAAARWGVIGGQAKTAAATTDLSAVVGLADHQAVATHIAEAAVTLVRDQRRIVPLQGPRIGVVIVADDSANGAGAESLDLVESLRRYGADARASAPHDDLSWVDQVVALTYSRGTLQPAQGATIQDLHRRTGDRLVVVATGDPYDLMQFPQVPAYLATYGADPVSLDAAARALLGRLAPTGRLPVSLPGLHPVGTGSAGDAR